MKYLKVWLQMTFSGAIWNSWMFWLLYAVVAYSHLAGEFRPVLLLKQAGIILAAAFAFSSMAMLVAVAERRQKIAS